MSRWTASAFLAEAEAWIRAHVEPAGAIEQPHVQPWATALRVPTADGVVWFKANAGEVAHEGPLVLHLSSLRPDVVPPPIAVDAERAWLLSHDAGRRLREIVEAEHDLSGWLDVLPRYAQLQREAAADVERLLALGVPDRRLATMPALAHELAERCPELRPHLGPIEERCAELAAFGIPETIQHDDLHDAQVFVGPDGVPRVLDWGDAVVSHPFLTLAVTLDGVIGWGWADEEGSIDVEPFQAAYLEPWGDPAELARAAHLARALGWLLRIASGIDDPEQEGATRARIAMLAARL